MLPSIVCRFYTARPVRFNGHPPLGVNATDYTGGMIMVTREMSLFQWAPTLGGECYKNSPPPRYRPLPNGFNGHPPLGVNATQQTGYCAPPGARAFQWAPTLGGECYVINDKTYIDRKTYQFQWAPTLGGECYKG